MERSSRDSRPATSDESATDEAGAHHRAPDLQTYAVLLRTLNSEFNRHAHAFAQRHDLHATDVHALAAILDSTALEGRPMTPSRLAERLNLTSGAVTACLDRLERAGHISRTRDSADRRVVHLVYNPGARRSPASTSARWPAARRRPCGSSRPRSWPRSPTSCTP